MEQANAVGPTSIEGSCFCFCIATEVKTTENDAYVLAKVGVTGATAECAVHRTDVSRVILLSSLVGSIRRMNDSSFAP